MTDLLDVLREALRDRYDVQRVLGRGGMATVFYADDLKHHRAVAIKVLEPELAATIGQERFQREIEIAARLQHPHILPLYDSGAAGAYLYYVMPFVEGESLRDRLERERQLSQEEVLRITGQVASALGYAHSRGVVHRDIKPENIMLAGDVAVVADFGIARGGAGEGQSLTQTGTIIGTPAYMSPEQAMGHPNIDGRSDEYSLACVVYEMLVGQPPFTGPTVQAVIARHSMDAVSPPSIVRETIPETMEAALLRALAKTPADRFPTVIMFAEALARPSTVTAAERRRTLGAGIAAAPRAPLVTRARLRVAAIGAAAVLVVAAGVWALRHRGGRGGGAGLEARRIAVLYFADRSPEKSLAYLADGFTEALIHRLSAVSALQVISPNGVAPYRNAIVSTDSVAKALQVGTIVTGSVTPVGDSLRVTVSMTNAGTGDEIGSTTVSAPRGNVLELQDTLAADVSVFLRQELGEEVQQLVARAGTRNARAWELSQQAEEFDRDVDTLLAAGDTAAASRRLAGADSLLAAASALDRNWIAPVVQRGWLAWHERHITGFDKTPATAWTKRGLDFAKAALAIDPKDPQALQLRGTMRYVRWLLNLDPAPLTSDQLLGAAQADLEAGAAPANPDRAEDLSLLSHLLARRSQTAQAKLAALQAYETDPYLTDANDVLDRLYTVSLDLEDQAEASKWCAEGYRRFPHDVRFTECQISLFAIPGQHPDFARLWHLVTVDTLQYPPNERDYRARRADLFVAMALASAGLKDSARHVALRARAGPDVDPSRDLVYVEILVRNLLGDRDEALNLLAQYLATNPQDRANIAHDETWWFASLRADPRFKALVGAAN